MTDDKRNVPFILGGGTVLIFEESPNHLLKGEKSMGGKSILKKQCSNGLKMITDSQSKKTQMRSTTKGSTKVLGKFSLSRKMRRTKEGRSKNPLWDRIGFVCGYCEVGRV